MTIPGKKRPYRLYGKEGVALVDLLVGDTEAVPKVSPAPSLLGFSSFRVLGFRVLAGPAAARPDTTAMRCCLEPAAVGIANVTKVLDNRPLHGLETEQCH